MKILADFHHNDLARSHQLLFARFGGEVVFPYGTDWFDEWYWSFERPVHGDAVARQYLLGIWEGAEPDVNGVVRVPNRHHPGTELVGLTLEAAKAQSWDLVISSVPDNAAGFHRLAKETHAKWGIHIGNQWGDEAWERRPDFAILTTTTPLPTEVPHVVIHQEFDRAIFRYEPPVGFGPISSFVNCFPENTHCAHLPDRGEYGIFTDLADAAPQYDWRVYGAYGTAPVDRFAAGAIAAASDIADAMRTSAVAYHSKHWSDGFGHIVHDWFAVGRPVLGHARYYADKLAGPLWIEGETSFDIEGKSRDEIVAILDRMEGDPDYHARLCENAAARFDAIVDFDEDAEKVRALLDRVLDPVPA